ncbi:hypothetical protein MTR67_012254 [Solanum verrucosum]|uniref:Tf2-1-like SH3-like domain-containing protein n=1 Tax=Solanum verrucosum TaxID=315347 RepID=A0AAF0Q898_SOLVR|nr:hypothetical protein MTR67_012254 [Solanum verrucosum]
MKGVMRFGKKGKLSPQYIGPYRISKRIGNVTYELELPQELRAVHLVFHISMLKKCIGDPSLIIPTEDIGIKDILSYEEIPGQILHRQVCKLRTKEVASVKVLWRNQFVEQATWEAKEDMKKRYLHLFEPVEIPDQEVYGDPSLIIPTEDIGIKDSLSYDEIPVQILDSQVRKLRIKEVASVKFFWRNQFVEEATWEVGGDMKKKYTNLF